MSATNLDTRLTDTNKAIRKFGVESAGSTLAKPKAALTIADARANGILTDNDGEACYSVYLEGRKTVLSKNNLGAGEDDSTSFKANVSKFTQVIKAAGLPNVDFVGTMAKATDMRAAQAVAGEKVKPMFDAYVDLARSQLKEPTVALSDDAITSIVRKKEAATKEIVDKLIDAYKRAHKLADEFPCQPMTDVIAAYGKAITEAGGDVPAVTDEEKDAAKVTAFLVGRGMTEVQIAKMLKVTNAPA